MTIKLFIQGLLDGGQLPMFWHIFMYNSENTVGKVKFWKCSLEIIHLIGNHGLQTFWCNTFGLWFIRAQYRQDTRLHTLNMVNLITSLEWIINQKKSELTIY